MDLVNQLKSVLAVLIISQSLGFFFQASLYTGTLSPVDPDVCTTTHLNFTCTLDIQPVAENSIEFVVRFNRNGTPIAKQLDGVNRINESVAEVEYYFEPDIEVVSVACYYLGKGENWRDSDSYKLQLGDTSMPEIYTMPQKVQNFNCVVMNYVDSMNCSWDYGVVYNSINVTFRWRIPALSATWNSCPSLDMTYRSCFWQNTSVGDFSLKVIDVEIILSQHCNVTVISNFTLNTEEFVKPDPVVKLSGEPVNSTCIQVVWNSTKLAHPKIHSVLATSKWPNDMHQIEYSTDISTEKMEQRQIFCGLQEDTEYTVSVAVKPILKGYWSDSRTVRVRTYSDVPGASPEIGGYSWRAKDCQDIREQRTVCIFWKSISEEDKNGEMKGIQLSVSGVDKSRSTKQVSLSEDSTYGCIDLMCNSDYTVHVQARNKNGSSNPSEFHIPGANIGLQQPNFIVEMEPNSTENGTDVMFSWTNNGDIKLDSYTVLWCQKFGDDCESTKPVYWYTVGAEYRNFSITLTSPDNFLYGVGATAAIGNSGSQWETCIYTKHSIPRQAENVVVNPGAKDNTLIVTWDKMTCQAGQPYISSYIVECCEGNSCTNTTVPAEYSRWEIGDLKEGIEHIITVRGVSKYGRVGPSSKPVTGIPVNKSLSSEEIGGIASAGIIILLIIAVAVVCFIRACNKKWSKKVREAKKMTIPEKPPELEKQIKDSQKLSISARSLDRQDSGDSGYAMTPPVDKVKDRPLFIRPDGYAIAAPELVDNTDSRTSLDPSVMEEFHNQTAVSDDIEPIINHIVNMAHQDLSCRSSSGGSKLEVIQLRETTSVKEDSNATKVDSVNLRKDNGKNNVKTAVTVKLKGLALCDDYTKATLSTMTEGKRSVDERSYVQSQVQGHQKPENVSSAPDYVTGHMSPVSQARTKNSNNTVESSNEKDNLVDESDSGDSNLGFDDQECDKKSSNSPDSHISYAQIVNTVPNIPCPKGYDTEDNDFGSSCFDPENGSSGSVPHFVEIDANANYTLSQTTFCHNNQQSSGYTTSQYGISGENTVRQNVQDAAQDTYITSPTNPSVPVDKNVMNSEEQSYVSPPVHSPISPVYTPSSADPLISSFPDFPVVTIASVKLSASGCSEKGFVSVHDQPLTPALSGTEEFDLSTTADSVTDSVSTSSCSQFAPNSSVPLLTSVPVPVSTDVPQFDHDTSISSVSSTTGHGNCLASVQDGYVPSVSDVHYNDNVNPQSECSVPDTSNGLISASSLSCFPVHSSGNLETDTCIMSVSAGYVTSTTTPVTNVSSCRSGSDRQAAGSGYVCSVNNSHPLQLNVISDDRSLVTSAEAYSGDHDHIIPIQVAFSASARLDETGCTAHTVAHSDQVFRDVDNSQAFSDEARISTPAVSVHMGYVSNANGLASQASSLESKPLLKGGAEKSSQSSALPCVSSGYVTHPPASERYKPNSVQQSYLSDGTTRENLVESKANSDVLWSSSGHLSNQSVTPGSPSAPTNLVAQYSLQLSEPPVDLALVVSGIRPSTSDSSGYDTQPASEPDSPNSLSGDVLQSPVSFRPEKVPSLSNSSGYVDETFANSLYSLNSPQFKKDSHDNTESLTTSGSSDDLAQFNNTGFPGFTCHSDVDNEESGSGTAKKITDDCPSVGRKQAKKVSADQNEDQNTDSSAVEDQKHSVRSQESNIDNLLQNLGDKDSLGTSPKPTPTSKLGIVVNGVIPNGYVDQSFAKLMKPNPQIQM